MDEVSRLRSAGQPDSAAALLGRIRERYEKADLIPIASAALHRDAPPPAVEHRLIVDEETYELYVEAEERARAKEYEETLALIEPLLTRDLHPDMRAQAVYLRDLSRYNLALERYHGGQYAQCLRLARTVVVDAHDQSLAEMAGQLVTAARKKLR